jgi:hypothetical protein
MSYVRPEEVLSPKNHVVRVLEVIHDPGEEQMVVARLLWRNDNGSEIEVLAERWNGNTDRPRGNPVSRGYPTWFIVDDYATEATERAAREAAQADTNSVAGQYRAMAGDAEREREAEEWSEGLMKDQTRV